MRSVIFRYGDLGALSAALSETRGSLPLPEGETILDGEWVLAIFEIGSRRRATAAAARGVRAAGDTHLEFERRDWDRLVGFVAARSELGRPSPSEPPSARATHEPDAEPAPRSRRFDDLPIESTRLPFGARVLVVDGEGAGDELRGLLAEMGLVVELVATTTRAGERLSALAFDALVLDLHASGSDARAFVGSLRTDPRNGEIPVLFLSSRPTSRELVEAFASGGDDFLPKPFRTPELAARIFSLLRRARLARGSGNETGSLGR